jgi:hypothetical protein
MENEELEHPYFDNSKYENLELRMYFFVPYNLSPIQQAIQAGHAALEYANKYGCKDLFIRFVRRWKTWIILNGGTTNEKRDLDGIAQGTLNQIGDALLENKIDFAYFQEPDLNDALTALCFIADERVFNKEEYPNFVDYVLDVKMYPEAREAAPAQNVVMLKMQNDEHLQEMFPEYYEEWIEWCGGKENVFLRELLKDKRLT